MALYALDRKNESEASLARAAETSANNAENWNNLGAAWAGTVPIPEFFSPENMQRIMAAA